MCVSRTSSVVEGVRRRLVRVRWNEDAGIDGQTRVMVKMQMVLMHRQRVEVEEWYVFHVATSRYLRHLITRSTSHMGVCSFYAL